MFKFYTDVQAWSSFIFKRQYTLYKIVLPCKTAIAILIKVLYYFLTTRNCSFLHGK